MMFNSRGVRRAGATGPGRTNEGLREQDAHGVGDEGIEPPIPECKSGVMPFHQSPFSLKNRMPPITLKYNSVRQTWMLAVPCGRVPTFLRWLARLSLQT